MFVVAWLGREKLDANMTHALMVIIEAAHAMGRMTPGCNISFYLLNLFAVNTPNPEQLKARLQFEIGEQWIPPNLQHLQNLNTVYDDDFLTKYNLKSFSPFKRLENANYARITKHFKEVPLPEI